MSRRIVIGAILALQLLCAFFFVGDIVASLLGIAYEPLEWRSSN